MVSHGKHGNARKAGSDIADVSLVPESEWEWLLTLIKDGHLVPVIGPELLCVPGKDGPAARLYDVWGEELALSKSIDSNDAPPGVPMLYHVASRVSMIQNLPHGDLEFNINRVIRGKEWPLPESLRLLAEVNLPLYITTTVDHLMARALKEVHASEPLQICFNQGGDAKTIDLPEGYAAEGARVVFHLFGAVSTNPKEFAATEDELIEFSWSLIDKAYYPKNLFSYLHKKTVLLIGCDFPDWLARFFIYTLAKTADIAYVSACHECGLRDFLVRRRAHPLPPLSPVDFVTELHRRWEALRRKEENGPVQRTSTGGPVPTQAKKGSVFISYCHEDREAAQAIRAQLDASGIDTWMDETGLDPGDTYREVIRWNIENASFFIALISGALDLSDSGKLGRFVFKEWTWAKDVKENRPPNASFLLPVAVDDTPRDAPFIDRQLRDAHWTSFHNGKVPEDFIKILQNGIRRFRSERGVTS